MVFIIRKKQVFKDRNRINEQIRVPELRLIGADGEQLGVVKTKEALEMASNAGLDLVEVAPKAVPPVCRIIDYGKFAYQQQKRAHEAKKKQKMTHLKEIKFGPNIDEHDLMIKLKHGREFLEHGDKLKLTIRFRGREMRLQNRGMELLERAIHALADIGNVDLPPRREGRQIFATLAGKTKKKGA